MHPFSLEKEITGGVSEELQTANTSKINFPPPTTGLLGEQGSGLPPFGGYE